MWENEQKYSKKMQRIAKSTQDLHERLREKKIVKFEKQNNNKEKQENDAEKKLEILMRKFK